MSQSKFTSTFLIILLTVSFESTAFAADLEALVKQCAMCHGLEGNSRLPSMPSFGGSSEKYFKYTMDAYKNGGRKSDLMKQFADNLTTEDINTLAEYYAQQEYKPAEQKFDPQLAHKGRELHNKYCAKCHDNNGRVDPHNYGILAGQGMPYLRLTIKEYLEGARRVNPMMVKKLKRVKAEVGPEGFDQLVHFYASVK